MGVVRQRPHPASTGTESLPLGGDGKSLLRAAEGFLPDSDALGELLQLRLWPWSVREFSEQHLNRFIRLAALIGIGGGEQVVRTQISLARQFEPSGVRLR